MNKELSKILYEMSELLDLGEGFKRRAYDKAARVIAVLDKDVREIDDLEKIPGIGKGIAKKIKEYIETGRIKKHEELKKKTETREKILLKEDVKKANGLVEQGDILGDLHCHSHWNILRLRSGQAHKERIKEIIEKAKDMGYEYIGISDHTKALGIEHGLNEKELLEQRKEIHRFNKVRPWDKKGRTFRILQGCEANILKDGSIDIEDKVLAQLDYVIAGAHSQLAMPKEQMTERIITAMRNPHVDIISHPTNRVIGSRPESKLDFNKILEVARETGTILEINANPARLDLKYSNIKKALPDRQAGRQAGVKMIIGTDAHRINQMEYMKFGVVQARKGGAEKKDILNTLSVSKLMAVFRKEKKRRFV